MKGSSGLSIGRQLFGHALEGGALASGRESGSIKKGFWADILALDLSSLNYSHLSNDDKLNYLIFSENQNLIDSVFSAGRHLVRNGEHREREKINSDYERALLEISRKL